MAKKKLDQRIRTLIENGVKSSHRSFFVIVGDHGREQVVNLHYILSKAQVTKRPSVLWCYKKDLGFSSHRQKRIKQTRRKREGGLGVNEEDPFELFVSSTDIRYTYYKETDKILGKTFGMCVLQDFEALEPNFLARTIETVQGGGLVVLLIRTLASLRQLYTMVMDVHARYRSGDQQHDAVARFNERFLLSLTGCDACLVVDDKLDVLPITSRPVEPLPEMPAEEPDRRAEGENKLVALTKTADQATVVTAFTEIVSLAVQSGSLRTTVSLTAARGRGKSAALGLAIAAALDAGLSNVFLTSPTPENLGTLFEFLFKGMDAMGLEEHLDYDIVQSTHAAFNRAVVRVNVRRRGTGARQTVLYISPTDAHLLGQAELLVVDEAAAIPLPIVQRLITGPYLVFMASTINGYEGTGRSLSLKLLESLRSGSSSRALRELALKQPIRYGQEDAVERWLNDLLCLDCASATRPPSSLPHPDTCSLFQVNRDTLFSFHRASEAFLQRTMALFVAGHYRNSPNDLQMLADAPGHRLFVLLGPQVSDASLPDILAVVHVAFEGRVARESMLRSLERGRRSAGDIIPWTVGTQFLDTEFGELSGVRVVRIAVHPEMQSMGYGSRALSLLTRFYSGDLHGTESVDDEHAVSKADDTKDSSLLASERPKPRANLSPLLMNVADIAVEPVHWIGASFGLTPALYRFWSTRHSFLPVYLRQTANDITGEHTVMLLKQLRVDARGLSASPAWLADLNDDFRKRFTGLLGGLFRSMHAPLAISILSSAGPAIVSSNASSFAGAAKKEDDVLTKLLSPHDLHRLEAAAANRTDLHLISDLLPLLAHFHFSRSHPLTSLSAVTLSPVQSAIFVMLGLQRREMDEIEREMGLPRETILAMTVKLVRKLAACLASIRLAHLDAATNDSNATTLLGKPAGGNNVLLGQQPNAAPTPLPSIEEDLEEGAKEATKDLRERQARLLSSLDLRRYEIADASNGDRDEWQAELDKRKSPCSGGLVSIPKKQSVDAKNGKKRTTESTIDRIAKQAGEGKHAKRHVLKRA